MYASQPELKISHGRMTRFFIKSRKVKVVQDDPTMSYNRLVRLRREKLMERVRRRSSSVPIQVMGSFGVWVVSWVSHHTNISISISPTAMIM